MCLHISKKVSRKRVAAKQNINTEIDGVIKPDAMNTSSSSRQS